MQLLILPSDINEIVRIFFFNHTHSFKKSFSIYQETYKTLKNVQKNL